MIVVMLKLRSSSVLKYFVTGASISGVLKSVKLPLEGTLALDHYWWLIGGLSPGGWLRLAKFSSIKVSKQSISIAAPVRTMTGCGGASIVACSVRDTAIVLKERVLAHAMLQGDRLIV